MFVMLKVAKEVSKGTVSSSTLRCRERASAMKKKVNKIEFIYLCKIVVICHLSHATGQFLTQLQHMMFMRQRSEVRRRMENLFFNYRKIIYFFSFLARMWFKNVQNKTEGRTRTQTNIALQSITIIMP